MIKEDNSFVVNQPINNDNLEVTFEWLKTHNFNYKYSYLNNTICKLWALTHTPLRNKKCILNPPVCNRTYNDLLERYIHISCDDPVSYKREIRNILLSGTNTFEIDIKAEAVYIFAKYISKDNKLLDTYINEDIYEIIHGLSRDQQKKLMQIWLQGEYNDSIIYNKIFPVTAEYLKSTTTNYKRNSGLFRDIETHNLISILNMCKTKCNTHLHDAIYMNAKGLKNGIDAIHSVYGDDIKFKINNFKNNKLSELDIVTMLESIDWDSSSKEHLDDRYKAAISYENYKIMMQYKDECYLGYNNKNKLPHAKFNGLSNEIQNIINAPEINAGICAYLICSRS